MNYVYFSIVGINMAYSATDERKRDYSFSFGLQWHNVMYYQ